MVTSESYVELVKRGYSRANQEGVRSYPVIGYEIFRLDQVQQRARRNEAELFRQLTLIFDWNMPRRQRDAYLNKTRQRLDADTYRPDKNHALDEPELSDHDRIYPH